MTKMKISTVGDGLGEESAVIVAFVRAPQRAGDSSSLVILVLFRLVQTRAFHSSHTEQFLRHISNPGRSLAGAPSATTIWEIWGRVREGWPGSVASSGRLGDQRWKQRLASTRGRGTLWQHSGLWPPVWVQHNHSSSIRLLDTPMGKHVSDRRGALRRIAFLLILIGLFHLTHLKTAWRT